MLARFDVGRGSSGVFTKFPCAATIRRGFVVLRDGEEDTGVILRLIEDNRGHDKRIGGRQRCGEGDGAMV
jgi:hypothetical protein